ncbi:MAG: phage integrase SAM-like domain-containing protein, partial [Bacteroidetes bacterium]|nr:phage integrase SAM-like domain-containing protein [Bacteroidota bacterium]
MQCKKQNMHKRPSASLWLDNRYLKKDNTFPIKIRITSNGNRTYYPTNIALTKEDFERAISLKPGSKLKEIHIRLLALEMQANRIIDTIIIQNSEDFSIEKFEALLNPENKVTSDVYTIFTNKIAELEKTGQISTAAGYQAAHNSLKGYHDYLKFSQVDKNFLLGYEKSMLEAGKSYSTV